MKSILLRIFVSLFALSGGSISLLAQLSMPAVFSDNMVLQQQTEAPIWGIAVPGGEVNIITSWNTKKYKVSVDKYGKWVTRLETPKAGGPYDISVTASDGAVVKLKNVLIGEVWFCSGQSNMEMPLAGWGQVLNYEKEIASAKYPKIRLLQVEKKTSLFPVSEMKVAGGSWQECSPESVAEFSATAYFFGRDLFEKLNVPIGLINSSWGGTFAEAWTSASSLEMMPAFQSVVAEVKEMPHSESEVQAIFQANRKELEAKIMELDFGYENNIASAASVSYNDKDWKAMNLPGLWEKGELPNFDGYVWFRREINIPASWKGKELLLSLGGIDDDEITYFNGVEAGRTEGVNKRRQYAIPAKLVKAGKAVITVRVTDTGGDGGFQGNAEEMFVSLPNQQDKISLTGDWKYKVALSMKDTPSSPRLFKDDPANPTSLFNGMVNPFVPYAIKGVIWYQGENNERRGYQYRELFPLMINDWRTRWGYDFPFYFAQLANFRSMEEQPGENQWAELREAQAGALHLTNTGMAVLIDIGDAYDIHPKNKQDVGGRLALIARGKTYGENIEYSGPVFQSYKIEGNRIRLSFGHTSGGLNAKDGGKLKGFAIAGADHKFHWADARIESGDVIVSSSAVVFPIAVRYGWASNPDCNLYNGAGLPSSPFRTDDWPGLTYGSTER
ncbi:9-O-acetylesterase [Dysgonomonas sp. GY75]|uniref:sialate O-acetylesterase n=1 Tax=Dysgonomonas sp. GY75 TaxID=2780419 RepID=UPI0018835DFD|nr:sialate O-acetylesterase [Dysgonomonas sp. GY75]MBF0648639.1 9-O-acetylesterase [Dysgonomonas sp. GY75]